MKIAIVGAGAVGGYLGTLLARAGEDVTLIARGAHLEAMRTNGITLLTDGKELIARPRCAATMRAAELQDFIVLTVKAYAIAAIAPELEPMLGPDTAIVTAQNGIPWWYFYKAGTRFDRDAGG